MKKKFLAYQLITMMMSSQGVLADASSDSYAEGSAKAICTLGLPAMYDKGQINTRADAESFISTFCGTSGFRGQQKYGFDPFDVKQKCISLATPCIR